VTCFSISEPLHIFATAYATNFRCSLLHTKRAIQKYKIKGKGVWPRSRDILLNFCTPSIFETVSAVNFRFGAQIDFNECYSKIAKLGEGAWPTSRDLRLNIGTPIYLRNGLCYKLQIWFAGKI